jgi:uncharacterized protein YbjT (DUF2867 family)
VHVIVLLTGASGFLGSHLAEALRRAGHEVVAAVRDPKSRECGPNIARAVAADFTRDFDPQVWLPRLTGIDLVINAVGILRERGGQTFDSIHLRAPKALFAACAQAKVRVIQISALGADAAASSGYHLSKKAADDALLALVPTAVVVQPSLVYGAGGTSAHLFTLLASLPLIPLPGRGEQRVQPIHVDDLAKAVVVLAESDLYRGERVSLVGARPLTLRDFLATLGSEMGKGRARFLPVPMPLVALGTRTASLMPGSLLDSETLQMLNRGNTADHTATERLLGRPPRPVEAFIPREAARNIRTAAALGWLAPVLRIAIALVWIVTGLVSIAVYPVAESYALLARVGITGWMAPVALYGAAALDLLFGIATLAAKRRRLLWIAQAAVILAYSALITWRLPEFWAHPYGPILKNLPMLASIWLLYELEDR